ncbi:MAG: hypothetical protein UHH87_00720 [Akkermansia sp.]|nr:hypothetical protein [Akkermansia sp.]
MKNKEHSLLYHTMHSRPMPGCLPLFFGLALIVVGAGIWLAPVRMPERVRPEGVGRVSVKDDRLIHFIVRRQSPLPLHMPLHADPDFREDVDAAAMPLLRPARLEPLPPQPLFDSAADSAVLSAEKLLALPGEAEVVPPSATPAPQPAGLPAIEAEEPVFHPSVDKVTEDEDSEEVPL